MIDFGNTKGTIAPLNGPEIIKEATYAQYSDAELFTKLLHWVFDTYGVYDKGLIDTGERSLLNDDFSLEFSSYWEEKFPLLLGERRKEYVERLRGILENNRVGTYNYIKHFLFHIGDEKGPFKKVLFEITDYAKRVVLDAESKGIKDASNRGILDATSDEFTTIENHNRIKMVTDRAIDQKIIDNIIPACSTVHEGPIVHDHFIIGKSVLDGPDTLG